MSVNYHTLADFRGQNEEFLSQVLTQSVATLIQQGLVELQEVSQDGLRVRASAGAKSFRREPSLRDCLQKAEQQAAATWSNVGSDSGQLLPMVEPIKRRFQRTPKRLLADGDFAHLDDIATVHADHAVAVYAPVKTRGREKAEGNDPYRPKPKDKEGVRVWRQRMGTEEAQTTYRRRAQTAEWTNARVRNWGLRQVPVRSLRKVRAVALLYALRTT